MDNSAPVRIQLSRRKGWRIPENTVKVTRPGPHGNPFRQEDLTWIAVALGFTGDRRGRTACAVELFRRWRGLEPKFGPLLGSGVEGFALNIHAMMNGDTIETPMPSDVSGLRGKNLACWCGLCAVHADGKPFDFECADCSPCHADTIGNIANG